MNNVDLDYGLQKENEIKPLLEHHFGKLTKLGHNDEFDFVNEKYIIEVKSTSRRRIKIDTYPSQMVGLNKINVGLIHQQNNLIPVFIFNCEDGIFVWFQDNNFKTRIGGRCDRGRPEYKAYTYIDRTNLIHIVKI